MISEIRPLSAGAALRLSLQPPAGARLWRILRSGENVFAGFDDPQALVVYEGSDRSVVDAMPGLINEAPAFYRAYYWNDIEWVASATAQGTPRASYQDRSTDVLTLVRDRLEEGLKVEIARGTLTIGERGYIQVLTAPPAIDQTEPPVVTVHLESEQPSVRGIGEMLAQDSIGMDGLWDEHEGWLADVSLEILGWCLNPDERIILRQALRRIVLANFPVFDAAGMTLISFQQRDAEFLNGEFGANVYQTVGSFSCQAPIVVVTEPDIQPIADVDVSVDGELAHSH